MLRPAVCFISSPAKCWVVPTPALPPTTRRIGPVGQSWAAAESMHARMIAIAVTEPRIPNDAPRGAVRSSALISCPTNSLLGILGSLPASDSRPKQDSRKGFGYPAFEDDEQCGL